MERQHIMSQENIKSKPKVSIAMAVYNGIKYIREQVDSILCQLSLADELVISIDPSSDGTEEYLRETYINDSRVILTKNPSTSGVVHNFQNALSKTTGDIIFYSDQDDIWDKNKIELVLKEFANPEVSVVFHDCRLIDGENNVIGQSTFDLRGGPRCSVLGNLYRLSYIGCAMAFRAKYKSLILPIPTIYRSHDWWTGCICGCYGKMIAINKQLISHRIHAGNVTPSKRPGLKYQMQVRSIIVINIIKRYIKNLLNIKSHAEKG